MHINGNILIGAEEVRGAAAGFRAFDPERALEIDPPFGGADAQQIAQACELADAAFDIYRETSPERRAAFLEAIASEIEALGDALIERAMVETALPRARLEGERGRTTAQLRLFAAVVRAGHWHGATLDRALPERAPLPRPDLRRRNVPLGPVAVFGASNFPLAFSVAGGDTASALAAGCPVVVKAHPAHPGTSELAGRAILRAARACGMPTGVFALVHGKDNASGAALVRHPAIRAVGFTGSRAGGVALMGHAAARSVPIPVFAEMSSVNPMYLLPAALSARAATLAQGFADSLTLGCGQFCTNPGLLLAIDGPHLQRFVEAATEAIAAKPAGTMLTPGIHAAFVTGAAVLREHPRVERLAAGQSGHAAFGAQAQLFATDAATFLAHPVLQHEIFGPVSMLVRCRDAVELLSVTRKLEGQLTATLQMDEGDLPMARELLPALERLAGRILANGFPTGVEVGAAMVHGGPFPATSDGRSTSVGTAAIDRFLRPVCYQNFPVELLPVALADANPLGIWRMYDGSLASPAV